MGGTHEEVVTDATGHLAQGVGVQGGHQQEIGPPPQLDVQDGVALALPHLAAGRRRGWASTGGRANGLSKTGPEGTRSPCFRRVSLSGSVFRRTGIWQGPRRGGLGGRAGDSGLKPFWAENVWTGLAVQLGEAAGLQHWSPACPLRQWGEPQGPQPRQAWEGRRPAALLGWWEWGSCSGFHQTR